MDTFHLSIACAHTRKVTKYVMVIKENVNQVEYNLSEII